MEGNNPIIISKPEEYLGHPKKKTSFTESYFDQLYSYQPPELNDCPFKRFHHAGLPSEFLNCPNYHAGDNRSKHILAGINDHSSGIYMKIQFIVYNLKDCMGIWLQLFLQKLDAIIVHADDKTVRSALSKDNFGILKDLVACYANNETKCEMVFRFWCLFYNMFTKNLVPVLPIHLKIQLLKKLQHDFSLATQNLCRCKVDTGYDIECDPNDEHRMFNSKAQMTVTAVLMYYILCKVGDHSISTNQIYKDTPSNFNTEKFIKETVVFVYTKLYESSHKEPSSSALVLMETLAHLILAFDNIPVEKNLFSSTIEVMLDMGCLSAALRIKDMLLNLLQKEYDALQKGHESKLIFVAPETRIHFTTLGISSVLKCLNNLISDVEYQILSRVEQNHLMNVMVTMQTYLGDSSIWNSEYEKMYLHCRHLQCSLEKMLGYVMSDVKLDSDADTVNDSAVLFLSDNNQVDSSISSKTSQSKLYPSRNASGADPSSIDDWPIDSKNISKLRKGYKREINAARGKENEPGMIIRWVREAVEYFVKCGNCCEVQK